MLLTAVLIIVAGLVVSFAGISVGARWSRRARSLDRGGVRGGGGGLACGIVVLVGAVAVLVGIADGIFQLITAG